MRQAAEILGKERFAATRVDPFALPARFSFQGEGRNFRAYLDTDRAILETHRAAGIPMIVDIKLAAFDGIAARLVSCGAEGAISVSLELLHRDPGLTIPLARADSPDDLAADWLAWGKMLSLPLLLITPDGKISAVESPMTRPQTSRRVRRFLAYRRSRFLTRRKMGIVRPAEKLAHREIIARN